MMIAYVLSQQRFWYCQDKGLYQDDSNNTPQPVTYVVLENSSYPRIARVHLIKKIFIFVFCLKIDKQHFTAEGSMAPGTLWPHYGPRDSIPKFSVVLAIF